MRRTPAATFSSPRITNAPMSPVRRTCAPPHSSMLLTGCPAYSTLPPTRTTRTVSPYFSPNSAVAPAAFASAMGISCHVTGKFALTQRLTSSSTAAISGAARAEPCEKSKRRRSGATSDPFCATPSPSTARSAACSRCVAV